VVLVSAVLESLAAAAAAAAADPVSSVSVEMSSCVELYCATKGIERRGDGGDIRGNGDVRGRRCPSR